MDLDGNSFKSIRAVDALCTRIGAVPDVNVRTAFIVEDHLHPMRYASGLVAAPRNRGGAYGPIIPAACPAVLIVGRTVSFAFVGVIAVLNVVAVAINRFAQIPFVYPGPSLA